MKTVEEVIAQLQKLPAKAKVVMSQDAEGNGFSPLYEIEVGQYQSRNGWSGELVEKGGCQAVVLWPRS
jgi:hypothetical protein